MDFFAGLVEDRVDAVKLAMESLDGALRGWPIRVVWYVLSGHDFIPLRSHL